MVTPKYDTTQVSGTGYKGYVQQPIADRSGALEAQADAAGLLVGGTAVKNAYNLFDNYNKANVLQGIAGQVEDLYKEQQDRSLAGQQAIAQDVLVSQQNLDQTLTGAGYTGDYPLSLNSELDKQTSSIIAGISEKTDRLANAKLQGSMTEIELDRRLKALTREELARNPAYANEIIAHVSKVSDIYGLTKEVKYDIALQDAMQKGADARQKEIRQELKERDIEMPIGADGNPDYVTAEVKIMEARNKKRTLDLAKAEVEEKGAIFANKVNQVIDSGLHIQTKNAWLSTMEQDLLQGLKSDSIKNKQAWANSFVATNIRQFENLIADSGLPMSNADIKDVVNSFNTQAKFMVENLVKNETGAYTKEELDITRSIMESEQTIELLKKYPNLEELKIISDIMGKFKLSPFTDPEIRAKVKGGILNWAKDNTGRKDAFLKQDGNESVAKVGTQASIEKAVADEGNYVDIMKRNVNGYLDMLEGDKLNPDEAFSTTSDLITLLATPEMKAGMTFIKEADTVGALLQQVDNYKEVLNNNLEMYFRDNPNIEINPQFLGNGALVMGNAPRELNGRIVRRINETFDAYVNITGKSPKEAQEEFYSDFTALNGTPSTTTEDTTAPVKKTSANEILPTLAQVESGNRHLDESGNLVTSNKGARGKYQIMPDTAKDPGFGVKPLQNDSEKEHRRFAQDYLSALINEFDGDVDKALAAYNAGPTAVKKAIQEDSNNWLVRLPAETQDYVAKILNA
jgi:hypothetical protein